MTRFDSEDEEDGDVLRRKMRGYSGAMVSTSLGSQSSFRMPSPVRSPTLRRPNERVVSPRTRKPLVSSDSSLDEMIDSFRASASSLSFSTLRSGTAATSPVKKTSPSGFAVQQQPRKQHKSILRKKTETQATTSSDEEVAGVSPMPKLTYVPKAKPTLAITAPKKPTLASGLKPPSRLQPQRTTETTRKPVQSELKSPVKMPTHRSVRKLPSPESSPLSNQSTTSSLMEEIDAPDSEDLLDSQDDDDDDDDPVGETSIDDLIAQDISHLNRLVSQSQEWPTGGTRRSQTSDDIARRMQQSTRFRRDHRGDREEEQDDREDASTRVSSFTLFSPTRATGTSSAVRLEPVRSVLHRTGLRTELDFVMDQGDEHDAFAEELRTMKAAAVKEKSRKAAEEAQAKKKKADEEEKQAKKESEAIGAGLSLRDCMDTIDKDLLLALRPFEKMRQELDREEAQVAATEAKASEGLDLPMVTQSIVEQLEQAFGGATRQREAEMKAEEDATAAAKAAEEAKAKEEEEKKAADELARKQQEMEILSLIPMHGRLMTTQDDVYDALARLEYAETMARESLGHHHAADHSLGREMDALRALTIQRAREIEGNLHAMAPVASSSARAVDWGRDTFASDAHDTKEEEDAPLMEDTSDSIAFPDVVRSEVVEKLELTILKLKHALSIDKKDAAEIEQQRKQAEELAKRESQKREEDTRKQQLVDADAAAARQRVMGLASLDELTWVTEADTRLQQSLHHERAVQRLDESLTTHMDRQQSRQELLPSFYDDSQAAERFDRVKMMMEAPYLLKVQPSVYSPSNQTTPGWSPYRAPRTKQTAFWGTHAFDNQRYDADQEDEPAPRQSTPWRRSSSLQTYTNTAHDVSQHRQFDEFERRDRRPLSPPRMLLRKVGRPGDSSASHHARASPEMRPKKHMGDSLHRMKHMIHQLQADRREKTLWFQASTRPR